MTSRRALAFIFCTALLDVMATGLMIPVLPRIVLDFTGGDTAVAAYTVGLFGTVWGLAQFVFSPLLGALSDRFGRRPVILVSCFGMGIDYAFMALAPSVTLLFVGRVISGVTAATIATAYAYIADVTPEEDRARAFGLIGVSFGLGFIVGPAAGGLLGNYDPRLPLWVASAACLVNVAFGWFVLPESLPADRRMPFSWRRANPLGALRLLGRHLELTGLAATGFLSNLAHQVLVSVFVLYAGYRYGWTERDVGLTLAFVGVSSAVVQGLLIGPAVTHLGPRGSLLAGLLAGSLGMAIYGLAPSGAWFCLGIPVMALWGLASAALQALMSRRVGQDEQGQLQGANTSLASITGLIGPGLFVVVFGAFIGHRPDRLELPGSAFLLAAAILLAAVATGWIATQRRPADPPR
jgi:DHA1 family tetracycline resistance protein-like MFS transporter